MIGVLLLFLAFSAMRGLNEGMVMYQPNVREHPHFAFYHFSRVVEYGLLLACGIFAPSHANPLFLSGALILAWEAFEIAYAASRGEQVKDQENVLGLFPVSEPLLVVGLHVLRGVVGLALVIIQIKGGF